MACVASVIDSSGVVGNLILASAIRNGFTSFPSGKEFPAFHIKDTVKANKENQPMRPRFLASM
jgi:hypothetical protein